MRYTFGLIGSGNMGGAIARAVSLTLKDGILADHSPQRAQELAAELGFSSGTNEDAARESQYLFLGVRLTARAIAPPIFPLPISPNVYRMGITPILFLLLGVLLKRKIRFPQRKKKGKLFFYCSTGHAGKQEKGGGKRGKFSRQNEKRW